MIEKLSELNPMRAWVRPLILAKMLVFSSEVAVGPIKVQFSYTEWISRNLQKPEARLYIDRLRNTQRLIDQGMAYLHTALVRGNLSWQDDLKSAEGHFDRAQRLAATYRRQATKSARDLFLPVRARALCLKGQAAYYRGDMNEAEISYEAAEGVLDEFDHPGSFGPITDVRVYSLSAAAFRAMEGGEEIEGMFSKTHLDIVHAIRENEMGRPRWPTELGTWLRRVNLEWPSDIIPGPEVYIPRLNRCIHLRILAKFESNWAYYQASIGNLGEAVQSAYEAARLMVEAYFGANANDVVTGRDLNWYLDEQRAGIEDVQNTGARAMLWAIAAAVRSGAAYDREMSVIVRLKQRDGKKATVTESLARGIDNLRKIDMGAEAEGIAKSLEIKQCR
ncbi:hypothetical protein ACFL6M_03120 [Candidatus Eisenbacteria bacterium]|uniref:Tetratricopeptide repeat protein n=1 Tax=Eiseniibacteriota bacterium TaxID=2212470 RepID=A0ABV6YJS1_UNCEI